MSTHSVPTNARRAIPGGLMAVVLCASTVISMAPATAEPIPARPAVVRGNEWHLRDSLTPGFADTSYSYGSATDVPVMGDWDGDGVKTPGVVRGNIWYLRNSNTSGFADVVFAYGRDTDIPVAGDWDGDGTDTPGVTREHITVSPGLVEITSNTWHLRNSSSAGFADITLTFSFPGQPIVGDWDGDGDDGIGMVVHNTNRWELDQDLDGTEDIELFFGSEMGDFAISGDWDGDQTESVGVVRGNTWFLKNENSSGFADTSFQYGSSTDYPLVWGDTAT